MKGTLKQKKAIKITKEMLEGKRDMMPLKEVMLEAGFSKTTSRVPKKLTSTKTWERFMESIDEKPIIKLWKNLATLKPISYKGIDGEKEKVQIKDMRVIMQAGENIMKLKGRFKEVLDVGLYRKREELFDEEDK